jgi:hypothetical protein
MLYVPDETEPVSSVKNFSSSASISLFFSSSSLFLFLSSSWTSEVSPEASAFFLSKGIIRAAELKPG